MASASGFTERVFYPVSDDLGEHEQLTYIRELLRPLLVRLFAERGEFCHVGSDQFIYWVKGDPKQQLAPDVYVLPGVTQSLAISSWKVWERDGIVPSWAFEVVSSNDWEKDCVENIPKYDALGVREVMLFDPDSYLGEVPRTPDRIAFTRFERRDGRLVRTARSKADRLFSPFLGVWFRAIGDGGDLRVRVALDAQGDELFPTEAEAALEAERAARQAEHAAKQAERAARESAAALEREVAALKRRLAELE